MPLLQQQKIWWYLFHSHSCGIFSNYWRLAQENGNYDSSFVSEALRQIEHDDNPDKNIDLLKDVAAQTYMGESARFICLLSFLLGWRSVTLAGADTTTSALGTFFLAMVCYPEVQKAAQKELDNVLNGRLPEHSDVVSLPYLSALVKEVYRYGEVCFKDSLLRTKQVFFLPDGSLYYH